MLQVFVLMRLGRGGDGPAPPALLGLASVAVHLGRTMSLLWRHIGFGGWWDGLLTVLGTRLGKL